MANWRKRTNIPFILTFLTQAYLVNTKIFSGEISTREVSDSNEPHVVYQTFRDFSVPNFVPTICIHSTGLGIYDQILL